MASLVAIGPDCQEILEAATKRPCMIGSGNRCGHDPKNPRWFVPPAEHKRRPAVLELASTRFKQYYYNPSRIPGLASARHLQQLEKYPDKPHKQRAPRSDGRESMVKVLQAIIHYCELRTMVLAVPNANGPMVPVSMKLIAKHAGLSLRCVQRRFRDLKTAGLLTVKRQYDFDEETQTYRGRSAIKILDPIVFGLFGLAELLIDARRFASEMGRLNGVSSTITKVGVTRWKSMVKVAIGRQKEPIQDEPNKDEPKKRPTHPGFQQLRDIVNGNPSEHLDDEPATVEAPPAPTAPEPSTPEQSTTSERRPATAQTQQPARRITAATARVDQPRTHSTVAKKPPLVPGIRTAANIFRAFATGSNARKESDYNADKRRASLKRAQEESETIADYPGHENKQDPP